MLVFDIEIEQDLLEDILNVPDEVNMEEMEEFYDIAVDNYYDCTDDHFATEDENGIEDVNMEFLPQSEDH